MGKFRGTDSDPGWITRKFRDIDRQLREIRAEKRLSSSTVGESGSLTIRGLLSIIGSLNLTGTLSMKSGTGAELVRMGDMPYGDRGFEVARDDGTVAFRVGKQVDDAVPQSWALLGADGQSLVEEQTFYGGLRAPYFEHPFQPVSATPGTALTCGPYGIERSTTSTAWETLFIHDGKRQNPFLDLKVAVRCSDATTAGEVQLVDLATGLQVPGFLVDPWLGVIPAGTTTTTILDPLPGQAATYNVGGSGAPMRLALQVRRTAGSGSISLAVAQSIGG